MTTGDLRRSTGLDLEAGLIGFLEAEGQGSEAGVGVGADGGFEGRNGRAVHGRVLGYW